MQKLRIAVIYRDYPTPKILKFKKYRSITLTGRGIITKMATTIGYILNQNTTNKI
jgi:hypothetical protein